MAMMMMTIIINMCYICTCVMVMNGRFSKAGLSAPQLVEENLFIFFSTQWTKSCLMHHSVNVHTVVNTYNIDCQCISCFTAAESCRGCGVFMFQPVAAVIFCVFSSSSSSIILSCRIPSLCTPTCQSVFMPVWRLVSSISRSLDKEKQEAIQSA